MKPVPLMQVDAFAPAPFGGNPAAVCWLEEPHEASWMQLVAREMNLSETAFLQARAGGAANEFDLRWFTPTGEVDLCGHATLASAHALWSWGRLDPTATARFHTRSGWLTAAREGDWIVLDFPSRPVDAAPPPRGLLAALTVPAPIFCGRGPGPVGPNWIVELNSESQVRQLTPDFSALARVEARSAAVTARGDAGGPYDFVSRFFVPAAGINEDPVTGSVHTQLATYWARRLQKNSFVAYQASERGGVLKIELAGDRVKLAGQAVTIFQSQLKV